MSENQPDDIFKRPSLARHFAAMVYDMFLVLPLFMAAVFVLVFTVGSAEEPDVISLPSWAVQSTWPVILILFFGLFWRKSGQTLGMQAWRIRLQPLEGGSVSWLQCVFRILIPVALTLPGFAGYEWGWWDARVSALAAFLPIAGLYGWRFFDRRKRYGHDVLSGTELILVPKQG
ncbi:conserved hypothetical protein [Luminiphilus syltensis NOR5-1B]|uniref:RDD domain-containing protein n=1 Tax=Luminiphilus syltensis NOR5-1B TaxID=565045 RepID=B8KR07_9GAMM|nr:RDD family protein [Luminiphilus syltensis]EED35413.1 conserved hypothetical protein [Luminiphilus syltensis NOR5-1B]